MPTTAPNTYDTGVDIWIHFVQYTNVPGSMWRLSAKSEPVVNGKVKQGLILMTVRLWRPNCHLVEKRLNEAVGACGGRGSNIF